jgi:hypothetical protein
VTGRTSRLALLLVAAIDGLYVTLAVAATAGQTWLFLAALLLSLVTDEFVNRRSIGGRQLLRRTQFGQSNRALLREVLLLLLVARADVAQTTTLVVLGLVLVGLMLTRGMLVALAPTLRAVSSLPVETRNVPLASPEIQAHALRLAGDVPPDEDTDDAPAGAPTTGRNRWRTDTASALFSLSGIVVLAGAAGAVAGDVRPAVVVGLLACAGTLVRAAAVVRKIRERRDPALRARYLELVNEQVRALAPEVVVYFSGTRDSAYQLNMWLPVLERTDRRPLVLLRERVHLSTLGPTSVPVVCLPNPVDVMNFPLPTARIALYIANIGKNIHLLREPRLKHVFIGHGDSDKVASVNPFSKVHDEIWVAGRAARERYAVAKVGVRDDSVVEVGRPQLDGVARAGGPGSPPSGTTAPDRPLTVLYAPTWEGWTADAAQTSLVVQGEQLLTALLDPALGVRVVFKPHPLTGTVTPEAATALRRILTLLRRNGALDASATPPPEPSTDPVTADERATAWSAAFWTAMPADRHLVVDGSVPSLFDCFNHADVLVGDISSVVSDFVASEKPYVVTNPDALPEDEFRAANPSTAGGYLLTPGGTDVAGVVRLIRGEDPRRAERRTVREHLLGPAQPPAIDRWNAAVEDLWQRAGAEWGLDVVETDEPHATPQPPEQRTEPVRVGP